MRAPKPPSNWPAAGGLPSLLTDLAAFLVLLLTQTWIRQVVLGVGDELDRASLWLGRSLITLWTLRLALAAALAGAVFLFTAGGLGRSTPGRLGIRATAAALTFLAADRLGWLRLLGVPAWLLLSPYLLAASVAASRRWWAGRLSRSSPGERACLALFGIAVVSVLLHTALAHHGEVRTRARIETRYAPQVLAQPDWRRQLLVASMREIDQTPPLSPSGPRRPGTEELAFSVWSRTELGRSRVTSAVEIQDRSGVVVSRFALDLPTLSAPPPVVPDTDQWTMDEVSLRLASRERSVLHASRGFPEGPLGAIHLFLADDCSHLPFLRARDPYSLRPAPASAGPRPVNLIVFQPGPEIVYSSGDPPLRLPAGLVPDLLRRPGGFWTGLEIDGRPHRAFAFAGEREAHLLHYPSPSPATAAARLVEASLAATLCALGILLLVLLARSIGARRSLSVRSVLDAVGRRFALKLFTAFVVMAVLPTLVLQGLFRSFVAARLATETRDQALARARMAKKAVEDFVWFQRDEAPGDAPVTDAALVWVASVIGNDVDVFDHGRLRASSRRELFASGLLDDRVSDAVLRPIAVDKDAFCVATERVGDLAYQVAAVRVDLGTGEAGILCLPMAGRQREVEQILADLDRTTRLASVAFLLLAAALARSVARRIAGPIRDLTRAAREVARGHLATRVLPRGRDETHELILAFNQMAADLERQQRDIQRSQRLSAWADLSLLVAHEVKNPLTPIQLAAEHLRRVFGDHLDRAAFERVLASCTRTILDQVRALRETVTDFSAFARPQGSERERIDLAQRMPELLAEVRRPDQVRLDLRVTHTLPAVSANAALIERAVVNLLHHAVEAVGGSGQVVVELRPEAGGALVEVTDSGPGLDPESADRGCEPFFSTRSRGSGLRLALVQKIAEAHGGGVELLPGAGGRVRMWLPGLPPGDVAQTG
jgi:signal transduction histidine kinase